MMTAYYIAVMLVAIGALCNTAVTWKLLKRVKKLEEALTAKQKEV